MSTAPITVTLPDDEGLREAAGEVPGAQILAWNLDGPPPAEAIDIVVAPYTGGGAPLENLALAEHVRLLQWQSIGYDRVPAAFVAGIPVANAASVHEVATSELAVTLALAAQREVPHYVRQGLEGVWKAKFSPGLADRRVLLIGYGGIGKRIEARLAGFEVEITRVARTAREAMNLAGESVQVFGLESLHERLAEADVVMIAVPLTDGTTKLLDAAALAALPDGALIVNVARGRVIDTDALLAELQSGRLRAALDVVDPEPLPVGHPLWGAPNTLVVPHVGGESEAFLPRISALIRRQIVHLQRGETPENLVLGEWTE